MRLGQNYPELHHRRRRLTFYLGAMIALSVVDGVISHFLVMGGAGWEWNRLLRVWVGNEYFPLLKLLGALVAALILWDIGKKSPRLGHLSALFCSVFYLLIVLWNSTVLFATIMI